MVSYFCTCATFLRMKEIIFCWSQGSYYDGRVGQHRAGGGWAVLHSLPKHSNPCGIATMESPILLLDEAQRMQLNFLSQAQQSMAVCCCVLIHKSNGSDIGMVISESKHGPFHTLILVLSSVLCHQCIKDKFPESSSVSYFFEIRKCFFFCVWSTKYSLQISSFFIYLSFPSNTVCSVL